MSTCTNNHSTGLFFQPLKDVCIITDFTAISYDFDAIHWTLVLRQTLITLQEVVEMARRSTVYHLTNHVHPLRKKRTTIRAPDAAGSEASTARPPSSTTLFPFDPQMPDMVATDYVHFLSMRLKTDLIV
jgi:hypothetical protein